MEHFLQVNSNLLQCFKPNVLVINTGGTFAFHETNPGLTDDVHFVKNSILDQLKSHFELKSDEHGGQSLENQDFRFWVYECDPLIGSEEMEMENWSNLCQLVESAYNFFDGFVIIHGTNTMDYTASALSFMTKVRFKLFF